ncbi:AMP-binding protein [Streptomyces malaysiensis]|uniref:AMP-binding protein n=1 Tax=Streptomyces malaysiensis TaxID=92644 RepID=UPI002B2F21F5|nr:AMP-binding protein [Streptomyces malaysiensis]
MRFVSQDRSFEQSEFDDLTRRAAAGFASIGVCDGDAVGLLMINEIEFLICGQALALLGAYSVPIGWHNTVDEIAYIAGDADLKAVVSHDVLAPKAVQALLPQVPLVVVDLPAPTAVAMRQDKPTDPPARDWVDWSAWMDSDQIWAGEPRPARPAIIYTSGTTGKPKGVTREAHNSEEARQAQARLLARVWGTEHGMRVLLTAPLYHSAPSAYVRSAMSANPDAGELHFMARFDAEEALRTIEEHRITSMWMVPTMFIKLLQLPARVRERYDVSSVNYIVHSGAPCPVDVKLQMIDWFGPVINEFYGSTEVGPVTYAGAQDYLARPGTVGKVLESCVVEIIGADGKIAPPGTVGEIAAANTTYASFTYHQRQAERDELDIEGLILCGDIGVMDADGYLFMRDRKKDMVISGGVNLYPAEIEDALLQLPNIRDGAAFGMPDEVFGEKLVAAVCLIEPEPDAPARIERELRQRLSPTKVPKQIFLLDDFPRSDAGKLSKHKLRTILS